MSNKNHYPLLKTTSRVGLALALLISPAACDPKGGAEHSHSSPAPCTTERLLGSVALTPKFAAAFAAEKDRTHLYPEQVAALTKGAGPNTIVGVEVYKLPGQNYPSDEDMWLIGEHAKQDLGASEATVAHVTSNDLGGGVVEIKTFQQSAACAA